jgi:transposase
MEVCFMDKESLVQRVLRLKQVEQLSERQIAEALGIGRKRIRKILKGTNSAKMMPKKSILDEYVHLIAQWYKQYPKLKALQVYERLKSYGYIGSYPSVVLFTQEYRKPKERAYHSLVFLPGEEAQIDWFFFNHERLGQVAGFVYILSFSRYAWGTFYPKTTFEFFLAGHIECFNHIGGLARQHRYDNLKSVILRREPVVEYNPQFLDFCRFYGFSIYVCNPYSGNEKGRVERLIRDIRSFLYSEDFIDLAGLNRKLHLWFDKRNNTLHSSTGKTPKELLDRERLIHLPHASYPVRRIIPAQASKTALVEFETNKYSLPSIYASKTVEIAAYPEEIQILVSGKKAAIHKRCFGRKQVIHNPLHSERLLEQSPQFKMQRIKQLICNMDEAFMNFINNQDTDTQRIAAAYQLFVLLKTHSRSMLISAVRELNTLACFKIKALRSLLQLPEPKESAPLWPQNQQLLNLTYEERSLNDYDPDKTNLGTA